MKLINVIGASLGGPILVLTPVTDGSAGAETDPEVTELAQRAAAANEYLMRGDIARYREVLQVTDDFTLMDRLAVGPVASPQATNTGIGSPASFERGKMPFSS